MRNREKGPGSVDDETWARLVAQVYKSYVDDCAEYFAATNMSFVDTIRCGSPIETAFAMAWKAKVHKFTTYGPDCGGYHHSVGRLTNDQNDVQVPFDDTSFQQWLIPLGKDGSKAGIPDCHPYNFYWSIDLLDTQVPLLDYRLDFVLQRIEYCSITARMFASQKVICECDGYDFHDRTKEQAERDKYRDRALQTAGFAVLRFTGRELWRDPYDCVEQAIEFMNADLRRQQFTARGMPEAINRMRNRRQKN